MVLYYSSSFTNSAMEAWVLCKSIDPSWCYTISTRSVEYASSPDISRADRVIMNVTNGYALDVESDSYWLKNGSLGLFMEHSHHFGAICASDDIFPVINCSYVQSIKSSSPRSSAIEAWGFCKSIQPSWCCTISTRYVECASSPIISRAERVIMNVTNGYALDVESDSNWPENGTL